MEMPINTPDQASSTVSTSSSPSTDSLKGSNKRKAHPRKRIIIDDYPDPQTFTPPAAMATVQRQIKEEKLDDDTPPDLSALIGSLDGSSAEDAAAILKRLLEHERGLLRRQISASASSSSAELQRQQAAKAQGQGGRNSTPSASSVAVPPSTPPPATAATTTQQQHPMLQAFAGLQNSPLAALFSPGGPLSAQYDKSRSASTGASTPEDCLPVDASLFLRDAAAAAVVASQREAVRATPPLTVMQTTRTLTLKRKLFDNNKDAMRAAAAAITEEERVDLDDLERFAQQFKQHRIKFGFTQGDVGVALGKRYGTDFSQTTISRFEALNLSFKNMCKLRPLLKEWLQEAQNALAAGVSATDLLERPLKQGTSPESCQEGGSGGGPALKKRRKRTNLDNQQKVQLDVEFDKNPRPGHVRMAEIADRLELERDVVRVWFCNRRQKVRKLEDERITLQSAASMASEIVSQFGHATPIVVPLGGMATDTIANKDTQRGEEGESALNELLAEDDEGRA